MLYEIYYLRLPGLNTSASYFFDKTGFEWELIEYSTDKADEQFLYE